MNNELETEDVHDLLKEIIEKTEEMERRIERILAEHGNREDPEANS